MSTCDAVKVVSTPSNSPTLNIADIEQYAERLRERKALGVEIDAGAIWMGTSNPLAALAALAGLSADQAARVTGVDVAEIQAAELTARKDVTERGIARLALAMLARLRGELRTVAMGVRCGALDDPLMAAESFAMDLANNRALKGIRAGAGTAV